MEFRAAAQAICDNVESVLDGKPEAAETALVVLLAEGHLLIEDVPGVGKTVLAKALARSVSCSVRRIQFTSDLMPSDVTGVSAFNPAAGDFEFKPGPVFANIVIGDEINRASPKTQSALLEAMEERQVTVDGTTYRLASPFTVVATQNPIEMEGTYVLPEAQRDRFMARIRIGYPDAEAELAMLAGRDTVNPFDSLAAVVSVEDVRQMIAFARATHVSSVVERYAVEIAQASRRDQQIRLGISPRATLQLIRAAKVRAAIAGRAFVLPDDVDALAVDVLAHRILVARGGPAAADVIGRLVAEVAVPHGDLRPS